MSQDGYPTIDKVLYTLGHPDRLTIIPVVEDNPLRVSDIAELIRLPKQTVIHHLKLLTDCGFVEMAPGERYVATRLSKFIFKLLDLMDRAVELHHEQLGFPHGWGDRETSLGPREQLLVKHGARKLAYRE